MKKFKAFTLVELLVVIVIFGILMSALMNFFKPLRQTYVDSTLYEQQRTAQNGILEYLCESTRYAEEISIYDKGAKGTKSVVSSVKDAVANFCDEHKLEDKDKTNIRVIVINRDAGYDEAGRYVGAYNAGYSGRIITNYLDDSKTKATCDSFVEHGERTATGSADSGYSYMALGGGYYGKSNYAIYIDYDKTWPEVSDGKGGTTRKYAGGITFTVRSALANTGNVVENGASYAGSTVTVKGGEVEVVSTQANHTKNVMNGFNYYLVGASDTNAAGSVADTGTITRGTTNTYIVYRVPTEDQR